MQSGVSKRFINREKELGNLNRLYNDGKFDLVVLFGKRRVGKTRLIKEFLKDKDGVFYLADRRSTKLQLAELLNLVGERLNNTLIANYKADNWYDFFRLVREQIKEEFVIVIDEYPYLTQSDSATSSIFQKCIDELLQDTKITLVLAGSLISIMYDEVLAYKAPLYGRNSGTINLLPLTFRNVQKFYPSKSFSEVLGFYSVLGGLPHYCEQFDVEKGLIENIESVLLNPDHKMFNEVEYINRESFREPTNYFNILRAVSSGNTSHSQIANALGISSNQIDSYLDKLINLNLLEKQIPVNENVLKSKKGYYQITDNFYRFWFKYVLPNKSSLSIGRTETVKNKFITELETNLGLVYEQVSRELLWEIKDESGDLFEFEKIGSWWGTVNNKEEKVKIEEQIDLMAFNETENQILFGECKWINKKVDTDIYYELKRKSQLVDWGKSGRKEHFILFSKLGFTEQMKKLAKNQGVLLVEMDRLIK